MRIKFLNIFEEKDFPNICNLNGESIVKEVQSFTDAKKYEIRLFYEGYIIDNTATPESFGASDDDELICFIDVEPETKVVQKSVSACCSISSVFTRHNGNNNTPPPLRKPLQAPVSKPEILVESDETYASRKIALGVYAKPLKEVAEYSCLKSVFLKNLQSSDSRLHSIFSTKENLFNMYISEAKTTNVSLNVEPAFNLLSQKNRDEVNNIVQMMGISFDLALEQYVISNMDIQQWAELYLE